MIRVGQGQTQGQTRAHRVPNESGMADADGIEKSLEPAHVEGRCIGDEGLIRESLADQVGDEEREVPTEGLNLLFPVPDGAGIAVQ